MNQALIDEHTSNTKVFEQQANDYANNLLKQQQREKSLEY